MLLYLMYVHARVNRIYPREHFKQKYAVDEVHYVPDVSMCVLVCVTFCAAAAP